MPKQLTFGEKDAQLIEEIKVYQKEQNIQHFIEAVRQLCCAGLNQSVNVRIDLNKGGVK